MEVHIERAKTRIMIAQVDKIAHEIAYRISAIAIVYLSGFKNDLPHSLSTFVG